MKKRTAIGAVVLSVLAGIGIVGCQQSEISESLVTIDVKADYPEKELTLQDFMEVEYIPLETNDEFITQGSVNKLIFEFADFSSVVLEMAVNMDGQEKN